MNQLDLIDCGVQPTQARVFAKPIADVMQRFAISTMQQRAAFVAQCMHESAAFTRLEEGLWYRTPESIIAAFSRLGDISPGELAGLCKRPRALANAAYGSLNGNRGQLCDDGWSYRGSGIIQLTGLRNFQRAQDETGRPYVEHPELVRTNPDDATLTAGLFWSWNHCNQIMNEDDFDGLSKVINLGNRLSMRTPNGNQARRDLYDEVLTALHARPDRRAIAGAGERRAMNGQVT